MKRKITKEAYEALSEALKALYEADGDNYVLELEDDDSDAEMERLKLKRQIESDHRKRAEAERDELKKQLKELQEAQNKKADDDHRKAGDVEALDKSWKAKFEAREKELLAQIEQNNSVIQQITVGAAAQDIATRISTAPELLAPAISSRLTVEYTDGKPIMRVLDKDGKPSAATLEDLEKEIAGDKRYASVIIAGNGSGGGGRGGQSGNGVPNKKFSELSEQERIDWYRKDPDGFRKAAGQSNF